MTEITMSIRKPAGAIFLALALITTTFAGISSADEESNTMLSMDYYNLHAYVDHFDNGNAIGNISATLSIYDDGNFSFSYGPEVLLLETEATSWESHWVRFNLTSLFEGNNSTAPTFEEGICYDVDVELYDDYLVFVGSNHMQISLDNGSACESENNNGYQDLFEQMDVDESGAINATEFIDWENMQRSIDGELNLTSQEEADIQSMIAMYDVGFYFTNGTNEVANDSMLEINEFSIMFYAEFNQSPWMDGYYDAVAMMMTVDFYDLNENSTYSYTGILTSVDTGEEVTMNNLFNTSTVTSISFDIDEILSSNNYLYGIYYSYIEVFDNEGNFVMSDGSEFCYGDYSDCEEVEEMFICDNGDEIPMSWYDDGMADCEDGSDEPNGTDDEGEDMVFASQDFDIWFEQWNDTTMEFVLISTMVIDDSDSIAMYATMADMFFGNDDGEVSQNEVDSFIEMINEEESDDEDEGDMQLDGQNGTLVDSWMDIEGLVGINENNVNDSRIVMIMVQVFAFEATPYDNSTLHTFTIGSIEDDSSEDDMPDDEGCDTDSIWIHNSDTWSVSSVIDSANNMSFVYEEFNNAWFTEDCPADSGIVTFNLVKTVGGELPDATEDNDWGNIDTNRFPICAYSYSVMAEGVLVDSETGFEDAPESGNYFVELEDGLEYMIYVSCTDPEGQNMTVTITNAALNMTSTYSSNATAEAGLMFSVPAGYDGTYVFDVTWTDGYHVESSNLTIIGLGDGSNDDDTLSVDGKGFLPGFTAIFGIVSLLGAAMISSRRN
jgi:hypothetical protein